jgi:hypothetical protein
MYCILPCHVMASTHSLTIIAAICVSISRAGYSALNRVLIGGVTGRIFPTHPGENAAEEEEDDEEEDNHDSDSDIPEEMDIFTCAAMEHMDSGPFPNYVEFLRQNQCAPAIASFSMEVKYLPRIWGIQISSGPVHAPMNDQRRPGKV